MSGRELVPYAGHDPDDLAWGRSEHGIREILWSQRRGLTLREIAERTGRPVEKIHATVIRWLRRWK